MASSSICTASSPTPSGHAKLFVHVTRMPRLRPSCTIGNENVNPTRKTQHNRLLLHDLTVQWEMNPVKVVYQHQTTTTAAAAAATRATVLWPLYRLTDWVGFNVPLNTLYVISGTGFYGSNERQTWCCLQVKLCDPCLRALYVPWCEKALYKYSSFPFLSNNPTDSVKAL